MQVLRTQEGACAYPRRRDRVALKGAGMRRALSVLTATELGLALLSLLVLLPQTNAGLPASLAAIAVSSAFAALLLVQPLLLRRSLLSRVPVLSLATGARGAPAPRQSEPNLPGRPRPRAPGFFRYAALVSA